MAANRDRAHHRGPRPIIAVACLGEESRAQAAAPSAVSARGWREAFRRAFFRTSEKRLMGEAAAVAFYALLAAFPAVASAALLKPDAPEAVKRLRLTWAVATGRI